MRENRYLKQGKPKEAASYAVGIGQKVLSEVRLVQFVHKRNMPKYFRYGFVPL